MVCFYDLDRGFVCFVDSARFGSGQKKPQQSLDPAKETSGLPLGRHPAAPHPRRRRRGVPHAHPDRASFRDRSIPSSADRVDAHRRILHATTLDVFLLMQEKQRPEERQRARVRRRHVDVACVLGRSTGRSLEAGRGDAAGATWIFRGVREEDHASHKEIASRRQCEGWLRPRTARTFIVRGSAPSFHFGRPSSPSAQRRRATSSNGPWSDANVRSSLASRLPAPADQHQMQNTPSGKTRRSIPSAGPHQVEWTASSSASGT